MRLAVSWEMCGYIDIEANTLEKAMKKFNEESDCIELPNGDYVDGSFVLSTNDVEEMKLLIEE